MWIARLSFFLFSITTASYAAFVGNPSSPHQPSSGVIFGKGGNLSLRSAFETDYLFRMESEDEFLRDDSTSSDLSMLSFLGVVTANFFSRLDLSGQIGSSKININDEMFPNPSLCWGVTGKLLVLKGKIFDLSFSGTYFTTDAHPTYIQLEGEKFSLLTDLTLTYEEAEAALAISYKKHALSPYIGATYLYALLSPNLYKGILAIPEVGPTEFFIRNTAPSQNWGIVAGLSLIYPNFLYFTLEGRFISQYAITGRVEIRF